MFLTVGAGVSMTLLRALEILFPLMGSLFSLNVRWLLSSLLYISSSSCPHLMISGIVGSLSLVSPKTYFLKVTNKGCIKRWIKILGWRKGSFVEVEFPAAMLGGQQPCLTPALRDPLPLVSTGTYLYSVHLPIHRCTHT